uniref:Uncharacterized protein n=1 Tax=Rousettus aegyptiacus TaxID=9407 RepID=A0A7J8KB35_ROUAE|nr:hypothetical protein HJG63_007923 [Rousettus aegyptiacus]
MCMCACTRTRMCAHAGAEGPLFPGDPLTLRAGRDLRDHAIQCPHCTDRRLRPIEMALAHHHPIPRVTCIHFPGALREYPPSWHLPSPSHSHNHYLSPTLLALCPIGLQHPSHPRVASSPRPLSPTQE